MIDRLKHSRSCINVPQPPMFRILPNLTRSTSSTGPYTLQASDSNKSPQSPSNDDQYAGSPAQATVAKYVDFVSGTAYLRANAMLIQLAGRGVQTWRYASDPRRIRNLFGCFDLITEVQFDLIRACRFGLINAATFQSIGDHSPPNLRRAVRVDRFPQTTIAKPEA